MRCVAVEKDLLARVLDREIQPAMFDVELDLYRARVLALRSLGKPCFDNRVDLATASAASKLVDEIAAELQIRPQLVQSLVHGDRVLRATCLIEDPTREYPAELDVLRLAAERRHQQRRRIVEVTVRDVFDCSQH